jgi:hypothetical protein
MTTRGCASLPGARGSFRCAQLATGVSGARCSPAAAMATAAGSGARARKDGWAFISGREAVVWHSCAPRRRVGSTGAVWGGDAAATCVSAGQGMAARPQVGRRGGDTRRVQTGETGRCGASGRATALGPADRGRSQRAVRR